MTFIFEVESWLCWVILHQPHWSLLENGGDDDGGEFL